MSFQTYYNGSPLKVPELIPGLTESYYSTTEPFGTRRFSQGSPQIDSPPLLLTQPPIMMNHLAPQASPLLKGF